MHKDGKWAKKIIELQDSEGKWGWFHSLSQFYDSSITTEQALRRLERLGYTIEDSCIQKAVNYMSDCLCGKNEIPDRREKLHDWDVFADMMLATWIRRFTLENQNANKIAGQWAKVICRAFSRGVYNHDEYVKAFCDVFGVFPRGGRFADFVNFYTVSMLRGCLDSKTESLMRDYILGKEDGIYYIYDKKLSVLPVCFESRETSRYLGAMELLSEYDSAKAKVGFVADWLMENKKQNGKWDMGKIVNDKVYFPLSDDWRKTSTREADCTERINKLIIVIT